MKLETQQSGNGSKSMDKEKFSPITESILANVPLCLANVARFNFHTTYACFFNSLSQHCSLLNTSQSRSQDFEELSSTKNLHRFQS